MKKLEQHGMKRTKIYVVWCNMKARCNNPNHTQYKDYGGRGIKVCDRWNNSFLEFFKDMGELKEGFTLDRKDVNGGYSPENCRWATMLQQSRNKRTDGVCRYSKGWIARIGVNYKQIYLGYFLDKESAIAARLEAEYKYW